ncbi:hypothetical protein [Streptomyces sp. NPDC003719]
MSPAYADAEREVWGRQNNPSSAKDLDAPHAYRLAVLNGAAPDLLKVMEISMGQYPRDWKRMLRVILPPEVATDGLGALPRCAHPPSAHPLGPEPRGGALPLVADRLELFRVLLADGSADAPSAVEQLGRLWYDMAATPLFRQIPAFGAAFGTERRLYGSDYCWTPVDMALAQVHSVDSAAQPSAIDTWRELTKRNAPRLFTTTAE